MNFGNLRVREDRTGRSVAFFCAATSIEVNRDVLRDMRLWSKRHGEADFRICLHSNRKDTLHQMILLAHKNVYHRPHREKRSESYHMIYGRMAVILFADDASVKAYTIVDTFRRMIFRVNGGSWHATVPLSPVVIFHEVKTGPFTSRSMEYAPWTPKDEEEGKRYTMQMLRSLRIPV